MITIRLADRQTGRHTHMHTHIHTYTHNHTIYVNSCLLQMEVEEPLRCDSVNTTEVLFLSDI